MIFYSFLFIRIDLKFLIKMKDPKTFQQSRVLIYLDK